MNTNAPEYIARLRDAQNLFRNREKVQAFKFAQALHTEFPEAGDIKNFHDAVARSILATCKSKYKSEDHDMAVHYAQLLLGNVELQEAAHKILLEAARAGLNPQNRAALLHSICQHDPDNTQYWREVALCIKYLDTTEVNIEIGFDVLKTLPGHNEALSGLALLIENGPSQ